MRQHTPPSTITELYAFCATCPAPQEVTVLLNKLGFHLAFQMKEQRDHQSQLPPLPAQFHFKDASGTEAIYLAGRDSPLNEDGESLPPHASRFWLYLGADIQAFQCAQAMLALRYQFSWRVPCDDATHEEVA